MRKRPVQQRSRQMVEAIITATGQVIAEEGLDALTTNRVAEIAGISNGSLYQYFHDRNDLIEALLEKISSDTTRMFTQHLGNTDPQTTDLRSLMKMGLTLGMALLRSNELYIELVRNWHRLPVHRALDPMEQYFLQMSRLYFLQSVKDYPVEHLQTRLYVLINSTIFTAVRFLSQDNPLLKEADVIDCLAETIALSLDAGAPQTSTPDAKA